MGTSRDSYLEAASGIGGNFVTNDDTLLSFTLWGGDTKIDGWEKYDGLPFPERMLVAQRATPHGRLGTEDDYIVIQYTFEMRHGIPECVHLDVESQYGNRSVRAKDVQYIRIDDVLEAALNYLTIWKRTLPPSRQERRAAVGGLMRRRRTISEDVLREVARVYEENVEQAPTQAVSDHFDISKSAADKRVKRARDAGYITKTAKSGRKPQQ